MDVKEQLKDIPIDQVAEGLGLEKRRYVSERNLQAFFEGEPQANQ